MIHPDISVTPNTIFWFHPYVPREMLGPCAHPCGFEKRHKIAVVAWGPSEDLYQLMECKRCKCRAWWSWDHLLNFRPLEWRNTRSLQG